MAKKSAEKTKPSTASKSNSKAPAKKAAGKASGKKSAARKTAAKKARKRYPPGKSKQIPYDLVYVADSDLHGKGMFAAKPIKANVTLGLLEGKPTKKDGIYVLWITDKQGLTVTNDFRFINHSSKPNCALTDVDVVTLKSIKTDEELTHDYGW